jgi:uncharacterized protein (DUF2267 family)
MTKMGYEEFVEEVQRRAGPISRDETERVTRAYLEVLRERLSGERYDGLAAHLPNELATYLEGNDAGEEFSVWEFYERLAQKAGIAPTHATRYARYVGNVLGDAVPESELDAAREELPPEYWELAERVLTDPYYYGSFQRI